MMKEDELMSENSIIISGFKNQEILFAGKILAYAGLLSGMNVMWNASNDSQNKIASCSVLMSSEELKEKVIENLKFLIVMNLESFDKLIDKVEPNGLVFIDSSMIDKKCYRNDIIVSYFPATQISYDNEMNRFANILMIKHFIEKTDILPINSLKLAVEKSVSKRKNDVLKNILKVLDFDV